MPKRAFTFLIAAILAMAIPVTSAFAVTFDTADNAYSLSETSISSDTFGSDLVWAGTSVAIQDVKVKGDILAAGSDISVSDSTVGACIRAACKEAIVNNVSVARNITIAGSSVLIGTDTSASGVSIAAVSAEFYGKADSFNAIADTVVFDGEVKGDVAIEGNEVVFGENAVIDGNLVIKAPEMPLIPEGASIGSYTYEQIDSSTLSGDSSSLVSGILSIASLLVVVVMVVMTLLIEWLMRRETGISAEMFRQKPAGYLGVGLLVAVAAPAAAIGMLMLVFTAMMSIAIIIAIILLSLISTAFTAASIGKLVLKNKGRYLAAGLSGAVFGVLSVIPIASIAMSVFCTLYLAGFIGRSLARRMRKQPPAAPNQIGG